MISKTKKMIFCIALGLHIQHCAESDKLKVDGQDTIKQELENCRTSNGETLLESIMNQEKAALAYRFYCLENGWNKWIEYRMLLKQEKYEEACDAWKELEKFKTGWRNAPSCYVENGAKKIVFCYALYRFTMGWSVVKKAITAAGIAGYAGACYAVSDREYDRTKAALLKEIAEKRRNIDLLLDEHKKKIKMLHSNIEKLQGLNVINLEKEEKLVRSFEEKLECQNKENIQALKVLEDQRLLFEKKAAEDLVDTVKTYENKLVAQNAELEKKMLASRGEHQQVVEKLLLMTDEEKDRYLTPEQKAIKKEKKDALLRAEQEFLKIEEERIKKNAIEKEVQAKSAMLSKLESDVLSSQGVENKLPAKTKKKILGFF